jgi:hypothetical protein
MVIRVWGRTASPLPGTVPEKALREDVIIRHKIGGGEALGCSELVQAKPNSYTIAGHNLPQTIAPSHGGGQYGVQALEL